MLRMLVVLGMMTILGEVAAISLDQLFPYGLQFDEALLPGREDAASAEVHLSVPLKYFQREHSSIFVNENGLVSFLTEISTFYSVQFPMEYPIIAPFYADIDTRGIGQVYWRASSLQEDTSRAANLVQQYYRGNFSPKEVVVVTWDQVGYYEEQTDKTNMVQLILASDGQRSYAVFLYPEGGINWVRGQGKNRNQLDPQAQAGFMSGEGQSYLLPPSGLDQISNIEDWSNTDVPGLWLYRVGPMDILGNVEGPEKGVRQVADPRQATSCSEGSASCHSEATCQDHRGGFCCRCGPSWYGDGKNCLREGLPQRVNGRVNGVLNGVEVTNQDLHCYVVTADGRTYTAISRIPGTLGWDMQGLVPLGTVISWLFALPGDGGANGFALTGGVLNYSAEVTFPNSRDKASILFVFKGMDVFDYLKADVTITGSVPTIRQGAKIKVEDNSQEFTQDHTELGFISAQSSHSYSVEGESGSTVPYTVQQTIQWEGCRGERGRRTMRLAASRNFIIYDENEGIVRYAMTSAIDPLEGEADPCSSVDCGPEGLCLVVGTTHMCKCRPGFTGVGQGVDFQCMDIDECMAGTSQCSHQAKCTNTAGSFTCSCMDGYIGDGRTCQEQRSCKDLACHEEATCTVDRYGQGQCVCNTGLQGDGFSCQVIPSEVNIRGYADPDFALLDVEADTEVAVLSDLGPQVKHFYEVINYGPYDIGNVIVNITWPLKNTRGDYLLYISERPVIKYSSGGREWEEECDVDTGLVDSRGLNKGRVRRQFNYETDSEYTGEDLGVGTLLDPFFEPEYDGSDPDYDYSHIFEKMAKQAEAAEAKAMGLSPTTESSMAGEEMWGKEGKKGEAERVVDAMAARVVQKDIQTLEAPIYQGDYSMISFFCRVNLAANEVGVINIPSHLAKSTLTSYPGVTNLVLTSTAELLQSSHAIARGNTSVEVKTSLEVKNPMMNRAPGRGVQCGNRECHKYASCMMNFQGEQEVASCRCPDGFHGDGEASCQPGQPESTKVSGSDDCRSGAGCGEYAVCAFQESGAFSCECQPGYEGDPPLLFCRRSDEYEAGYPAYPPPSSDWGRETTTESWLGPLLGTVRPAEPTPTCRYGVCSCPGNLVADMKTNRCVKNQPGLCSAARDCHPAADCVYSREGGYYRCECLRGYVGDGLRCDPGPDADCQILENCHQDAACLRESSGDGYYCRCMDGHHGNGTHCEEEIRIGCNVLNNCGRFASCLFNHAEGGFNCICDGVRGFEGDGYTCSPRGPCHENPAVCDPNADCIPQRDHSSMCRCKQGFNPNPDGFDCKAAPRFEGNFALLAQGMMIFKVPLSGRGSSPVIVQSSQVASGIDIDCMKGQVYWSDTTNKMIRRAGIDGKGVETLLSADLSFPEGIAVDWVSRNIYFTDPGRDTIEVASLEDGTRMKLLADTEVAPRSPRGIAVHPGIGRVFWTDWDREEPKIEMANLDGTDRQTLVDNGLGEPNSLVVDYESWEVCWADAGSKATGLTPRIECIGVNRSNRRLVIELQEGSLPYGLALTPDSILWTDWNRRNQRAGVHRADKRTGIQQIPVRYGLSHIGKPYDLVNVPAGCPRDVTNSCQGQPCGPGRICLPNGLGSHSCK